MLMPGEVPACNQVTVAWLQHHGIRNLAPDFICVCLAVQFLSGYSTCGPGNLNCGRRCRYEDTTDPGPPVLYQLQASEKFL